ncbi:LTA synthase family protein [Peptostreptococcus faecalis]|uniref:LTA synthase family protein n=1 Tax=Peptostreptococcus faecalis TaxID=2045015 RepID=UPI000C7A5048|nr:LTA synthase family protein [Peptostreptococcus faecalis]
MKKVRKNKKLYFKENNSENRASRFSNKKNNGSSGLNMSSGSRYTRKQLKKENPNIDLSILFIYSFLVYVLIETISRRSFTKVLDFFIEFPIHSVVNYILITLIFSITIFVKKKKFMYFILTFSMILLSTTSSILQVLRGMPLSPYDIATYKEVIEVMGRFLNIKEILLIAISVIFIIFVSIYIFIKDKRINRISGKRNIIVFFILLIPYMVVVPRLEAAKILDPIAWNVGLSYENNGFVYSFVDACTSAIRKKPEGYNKATIEKIREEVDEKQKNDSRKILTGSQKPNIVFLQLEAFMDPTELEGVNFSEDPIPNVRKLMKTYTSGKMNVPVTGGGTARTEYEVLSGSNFDYLNQGEIPYQTILSKKTSPSIAYSLNSLNYSTTAIHNYYERFYNRNVGLKNLGFDKFIPLEVMTKVDYTEMGWPKDDVLLKYIMNELNQEDDNQKMVFTISTQGHSKYPTTSYKGDPLIELQKTDLPKEDLNQVTYYINQLKEMDNFVGELVEEINSLKKPTTIVLYGDHMPALDILSQDRTKLDRFSSVFAIVNNYGDENKEIPKDFQSYQLSTLAMEVSGQPYGPMNLVHAYLSDDKDYQKKLELVQYDLLFGERYFLKDEEKPQAKSMKVGNEEMKLESVEENKDKIYLKGNGFNRFIYACVDGEQVKTDYIDENNLSIDKNKYSGEKEISLIQHDNDENKIAESKKIKHKF